MIFFCFKRGKNAVKTRGEVMGRAKQDSQGVIRGNGK